MSYKNTEFEKLYDQLKEKSPLQQALDGLRKALNDHAETFIENQRDIANIMGTASFNEKEVMQLTYAQRENLKYAGAQFLVSIHTLQNARTAAQSIQELIQKNFFKTTLFKSVDLLEHAEDQIASMLAVILALEEDDNELD